MTHSTNDTQHLDYSFLEASPVEIEINAEGNFLSPVLPTDQEQLNEILDYFECDKDTIYRHYPISYSQAIPVDSFLSDDLWKFYKTCMVPLVDEQGDYYLMLGGGGMDMSWQIANAFYSLGFAVPLWVCKLPAMAGRGLSDQDQELIKACNKSLKSQINSLEYALCSNDGIANS
jgi:hypothetical protein